ncbi:MAG: hypothetical protein M1825_005094 [Sarcosagium campestre]|nr:MAG: hypothetical protein M1825_005094 [Sarcosagium campestre]
MPPPTEREKMLRGELYYAFTPELTKSRLRCQHACSRLNKAGEASRRQILELWRDVVQDTTPLPPPAATQEEDDALLGEEPWVESPVFVDYGTNVELGRNVYINFNCVILDTCKVRIGSRTMLGPNVSLYSGTHPLDPALRNGTKGPELGKEINIGEDVWIGGSVVILPGVTVGNGATIGAGSVVTKDVPAYHVAAGNPARVIRKIETELDPSTSKPDNPEATAGQTQGAEAPMADEATKI